MKFPSPLGVSYFQMLLKRYNENLVKAFPSPLGVSYFQIKKSNDAIALIWVSVPSRGILFPNLEEDLSYVER